MVNVWKFYHLLRSRQQYLFLRNAAPKMIEDRHLSLRRASWKNDTAPRKRKSASIIGARVRNEHLSTKCFVDRSWTGHVSLRRGLTFFSFLSLDRSPKHLRIDPKERKRSNVLAVVEWWSGRIVENSTKESSTFSPPP